MYEKLVYGRCWSLHRLLSNILEGYWFSKELFTIYGTLVKSSCYGLGWEEFWIFLRLNPKRLEAWVKGRLEIGFPIPKGTSKY